VEYGGVIAVQDVGMLPNLHLAIPVEVSSNCEPEEDLLAQENGFYHLQNMMYPARCFGNNFVPTKCRQDCGDRFHHVIILSPHLFFLILV
jgi:hypothetical protein